MDLRSTASSSSGAAPGASNHNSVASLHTVESVVTNSSSLKTGNSPPSIQEIEADNNVDVIKIQKGYACMLGTGVLFAMGGLGAAFVATTNANTYSSIYQHQVHKQQMPTVLQDNPNISTILSNITLSLTDTENIVLADDSNNNDTISSPLQQNSLPPLDQLIDTKQQLVVGNVDWLLDFAIIGFPIFDDQHANADDNDDDEKSEISTSQWISQHFSTSDLEIISTSSIVSSKQHQQREDETLSSSLFLSQNDSVSFIQQLYEREKQLQETLALQQQVQRRRRRRLQEQSMHRVIRGIQALFDLQSPNALKLYQTLFSKRTKFIIQLQHPVLWFQSMYNFYQIQHYRQSTRTRTSQWRQSFLRFFHGNNNNKKTLYSSLLLPLLPPPMELIGKCNPPSGNAENNDYYFFPFHTKHHCRRHGRSSCEQQQQQDVRFLCTDDAQFHHYLSRLGLTAMTTSAEWDLLGHHNMTILDDATRTTTPVFLVEHQQLLSSEGASILYQDLQTFFDMPAPTNDKNENNKKNNKKKNNKKKNGKQQQSMNTPIPGTINICDPEHQLVRSALVGHGQRMSKWIQYYLLPNPLVVVSSREHFIQLIQSYEIDPCIPQSPPNQVQQAVNVVAGP